MMKMFLSELLTLVDKSMSDYMTIVICFHFLC